MYQLIKNQRTGIINSVVIENNGVRLSIPFDPDNTDYQQYLKWLSEGNTPEPADEVTGE
jgi:hypothetical protein